MEDASELALHYSPNDLPDVDVYFEERKVEIEKYFDKDINPEDYIKDEEKDFLKENMGLKMDFVFLSVDIVNSTYISRTVSTSLNSEIKDLFVTEMSLSLSKFHGKVLKYVGDEVLAYFHKPDLLGKTDNAINCACIMKLFVSEVLNPFLESKELGRLKIRIGVDLGAAKMKQLAIQTGNPSEDILGFVIDLTLKIQKEANPDQILVGESATEYSHTYWREKLQEIDRPSNWNFKNEEIGQYYKLFSLEKE